MKKWEHRGKRERMVAGVKEFGDEDKPEWQRVTSWDGCGPHTVHPENVNTRLFLHQQPSSRTRWWYCIYMRSFPDNWWDCTPPSPPRPLPPPSPLSISHSQLFSHVPPGCHQNTISKMGPVYLYVEGDIATASANRIHSSSPGSGSILMWILYSFFSQ